MTDQFGRQKSTRWQKAVPTYGDYDDAYGGYDDYEDDDVDHEQQRQQPIPQKFELPQNLPPLPNLKQAVQEQAKPEELVLSVDRMKPEYDSSDDEFEDVKQTHEDTHEPEDIATTTEAESVAPPPPPPPPQQQQQEEEEEEAHTPVEASPQEKEPLSEESLNFQSLSPITTDHNIEQTILDRDFRKQLYQPPDTPMSETSFQSDYSIQKETELNLKVRGHDDSYEERSDSFVPDVVPPAEPEPFVLSIDKKKYDSSSDDDDDDDDDWGYNSQHSSNLDAPADTRKDSIDELIKDIHASTIDQSESSSNLARDSSFGIYASYINYSNDDQTSPIRPLSTARLEEHGEYMNTLSSRKPSVRKPPMVKSDTLDSSKLREIISPLEQSESVSDRSAHEEDELRPEESGLHASASTGSLSTGKLSVEPDNKDLSNGDIERDMFAPPAPLKTDSRRVSTISNATFNLGGWTPNTDNFRNQFVNYNDDNSIREEEEEEEKSNTSSISVPETVDASLPKVDETIDEEDDEPDVYSPSPVNETQSMNPTIMTSTTVDSVLKEHQYSQPLFKEEKLTPGASTDNLPPKYTSMLSPKEEKQFLSPTKENNRLSDISAVSTETDSQRKSVSSGLSAETVPTFVPAKYPVYDWKKITAISQPIDRIAALKDAQQKEAEYDTGLQNWLMATLKQVDPDQHIHIGKIATDAYQNAAHSEIRRHGSILSKVSIVKDTGAHASNFGKKLFSRSKKFMRSASEAK
ncbi:uncharacterized protein SPAPADRAFT_51937 [Spathaspora passalidarum NRRL Y-27907]|uniref:Protein FYV8 n=1 Tax=Spathaspora passalidarum (strain NRRL Y-27907 / 11-Y1) TaxID=619300 RepID=G3ASP2_SPAPN|nr:uncharacterized protein SPAPADRAFT_51937 [Spathaspora passalidarum NRRL Y-27907]EGW30728.1 hypothetical protein SPAPADRAFT_51937 [Spathaspora passalidarum NRRL Y-27907]